MQHYKIKQNLIVLYILPTNYDQQLVLDYVSLDTPSLYPNNLSQRMRERKTSV